MSDVMATPTSQPRQRLVWLDMIRGVALIAMASYHFMWDLGDFGYIDASYPATGWPKIYARCIASTFLFLAGFSLVISHCRTIRWPTYWKRLAKIVAAAALVSLGSYLFMPQGLIFFGILHAIAAMSLIGLAFLRLPAWLTAIIALLAFAAPHYLASDTFNTPWLWWLGLSTEIRLSFDYVPLLPWLCPFLLGMAASRLWLRRTTKAAQVEAGSPNALQKMLAFISRYSLGFYLIHQPVMISLLFLYSLILPAPAVDPGIAFTKSCEKSCTETRDAQFCTRFCGCARDKLNSSQMLEPVMKGKLTTEDQEALESLRLECTANAE